MKYSCLILVVLSALFSSCKKDFEPLFDEEAMVRTLKFAQDCKNNLVSSKDYGWRFDYSTEYKEEMTFIMQFTEDGRVHMETTDGLSSNSSYGMVTSEGVILSFDTYCELAKWSDPSQTGGGGAGVGYGGDIEFIITAMQEDTIFVVGRKHKDKPFKFVRAKLGEKYKALLDRELDMSRGLNISYFHSFKAADGSVLDLFLGTDKRSLDFLTGPATLKNVPYEITADGFKLSSPVTVGGETVSEFVWDYSKSAFVANSGSVSLVASNKLAHTMGNFYDDFFAVNCYEVMGGGQTTVDAFKRFGTAYAGFEGVEFYINATFDVDTLVYRPSDTGGDPVELRRVKGQKSMSGLSFRIAEATDWLEWTSFFFKPENVIKVSDDSFKALETNRDGPLSNSINRNNSLLTIKGVVYDGKYGTTIIDKGNGIYHLVSMASAKNWLVLKKKELKTPQMLILKEEGSN